MSTAIVATSPGGWEKATPMIQKLTAMAAVVSTARRPGMLRPSHSRVSAMKPMPTGGHSSVGTPGVVLLAERDRTSEQPAGQHEVHAPIRS